MRRVRPISDLSAMDGLHSAVACGNLSTLAELLKSGASANCQDSYGTTPLHRAAWQCDAVAVSLLLANGADAKAVRVDGTTPLDLVELRQGKCLAQPKGLSDEIFKGECEEVIEILRVGQDNNGLDFSMIPHVLKEFLASKSMFDADANGELNQLSLSSMSTRASFGTIDEVLKYES